MKHILFILLLLFGGQTVFSQTITGIVADNATKKPVSDASVYLDGTAVFTTTDEQGKFTLNVSRKINTRLIISHMAYETATYPINKVPEIIFLTEKSMILHPIVVVSDRFSREQKLNAFREQFLGYNKAGKACRILNEDDIQLFYDLGTNTLTATSGHPIIIENDYLGYKLSFELADFSVKYFTTTLNKEKVKQSFYAGASSFIDLKPDDKKMKKRRDDSYLKSSLYFFKNFANKTLAEAGYLLFNKGFKVNPNSYFYVTDTLSMKMIHIIPDTNIEKFSFAVKGVEGKVSALYKKKTQTDIIFLTDAILVDYYGNIAPVENIYFTGHFGEQKIGNLLPLDYEWVTDN